MPRPDLALDAELAIEPPMNKGIFHLVKVAKSLADWDEEHVARRCWFSPCAKTIRRESHSAASSC
jgi:hypothetical protein